MRRARSPTYVCTSGRFDTSRDRRFGMTKWHYCAQQDRKQKAQREGLTLKRNDAKDAAQNTWGPHRLHFGTQ
jgi:hypothetical protein